MKQELNLRTVAESLLTLWLVIFVVAIFMIFMGGCGSGPWVVEKGTTITCQAVATSTGSDVKCSDGTVVHLKNGLSTVVAILPATSLQCANGGNVIITALDQNGNEQVDPSDSNFEEAIVCNGSDGAQGSPGTPGTTSITTFSAVNVIQPCGANSSPYKEVLLCLADGQILGSFSDNANGQNTRFAFIPAGSYDDTDSSGCNFNVSSDGDGGSIVSWNSGANQYSTWGANQVTCTAITVITN